MWAFLRLSLKSLGHVLDLEASFEGVNCILKVLLMVSDYLDFCLILVTLGDLFNVGGFLCKMKDEILALPPWKWAE